MPSPIGSKPHASKHARLATLSERISASMGPCQVAHAIWIAPRPRPQPREWAASAIEIRAARPGIESSLTTPAPRPCSSTMIQIGAARFARRRSYQRACSSNVTTCALVEKRRASGEKFQRQMFSQSERRARRSVGAGSSARTALTRSGPTTGECRARSRPGRACQRSRAARAAAVRSPDESRGRCRVSARTRRAHRG